MVNVKVDICLCTSCVMHGAESIIEAIESLSLLKGMDNDNINIEIVTHKILGKATHQTESSPVITVNGTVLEKVNTQTAMSYVLGEIIEKGK